MNIKLLVMKVSWNQLRREEDFDFSPPDVCFNVHLCSAVQCFQCVFDVTLWCVCRSGTHGYMAPEVLQKGTAYDSSADWFSLGCMLFKLLRG